MNNFDIVTEQCVVAQEGSTKDAIEIMEGADFNKAISTMKDAIAAKNKADYKTAIKLFSEARIDFRDVRKKISSLRTYPISMIIGNGVIGTIYAWSVRSKSIKPELLGVKKARDLKILTGAYDAIGNILTMFGFVGPQIGIHIGTALRNKVKDNTQAAKYFNQVCARFIYIIDFYIDRCDYLSEQCSKMDRGEIVTDD